MDEAPKVIDAMKEPKETYDAIVSSIKKRNNAPVQPMDIWYWDPQEEVVI